MATNMQKLGDELTCAVCMDRFDDPVTLSCGHNFCSGCIEAYWDGAAIPSCPQCRKVFQMRPRLQRNTVLANIVSQLHTKLSLRDEAPPPPPQQPQQCAMCHPAIRLAAKSCFTCELSFCLEHAQLHMTPAYSHHQLVEPAVDMVKRKCPEHRERLKYVCTEDKALLCVDCTRVGIHKTHDVVTMEKEDAALKITLQGKLDAIRRKKKAVNFNKHAFSVRDQEIKTDCAAYAATLARKENDVKVFFEREVRLTKQTLTADESKALQDGKEGAASLDKHLVDIDALEVTTRALLKMTDSLSFVQECPTQATRIDVALAQIPDSVAAPQMDKQGVTQNLAWLDSLLTHINKMHRIKHSYPWKLFNRRKLVMDLDTAHLNLAISHDRRMAAYSEEAQKYPQHRGRFEFVLQVLCTESFSAGQHYWEVYVKSGIQWEVGVTYGAIGRKQHDDRNVLGNNAVSWCFSLVNGEFSSWHDGNKVVTDVRQPPDVIGVHLDCDGGALAFYDAGSMARLHSFAAKFTQPLFPAFGVYPTSSLAICDFGLLQ